MAEPKPLLIYHGDCAFCAYWVRYWRKLIQGRVSFASYQQVAASYPEISADEYSSAVQYVRPAGKIAHGAGATFLTLSHAPGRGFWLKLYRSVPEFAQISEHAYSFVAARHDWFYRPTFALWRKNLSPPQFNFTI